MAEKIDKDLDFLSKCSNEQLKILCDILTKDSDGHFRYTEMISIEDVYKANYPDNMIALLPLIKEEIYAFGGNSFANFFRKIGLTKDDMRYRDILEAVCDRAQVNYNQGNSTELVERYLIQKTCITSIEKMNLEDVYHIAEQINKTNVKTVVRAVVDAYGKAFRVIVPAVLAITYFRYSTQNSDKCLDEVLL